jgi:ATP-dependent DNA helicase RecG
VTKRQLEYFLQEGESFFTEFKETVNKSLAKEMVAFANAAGGRIIIGVDDHQNIIGIKDSNKLRSAIQDIANNCQPAIPILLEELENVMIIHISEGIGKPFQCSEGFFLRTGPNSQKMGREQIIDFLQAEGHIRFEEQFNQKFNFEKHYSAERLTVFLELAGITKTMPDIDILENLGVGEYKDNEFKLNNCGILFFSNNQRLLCEQATVTCVTFVGTQRIDVVNRKDYDQDMIRNIENAMNYLRQELRVKYIMTDRPDREEVYELPLPALREAVINAVSHRNYLQSGSHTVIEVFADRVEISNPGGLVRGITSENFGKKAVRRNQLIADLLHRIRFVENLGTGISKINQLLKSAKAPQVQFKYDAFFTAIFTKTLAENNGELNGGLNGGLSGKLNGRLSGGLNLELKQMIDAIKEAPGIKAKDLSQRLQRSINTVDKQIKKLIDWQLIERRGSKKSGGYFIRTNGKNDGGLSAKLNGRLNGGLNLELKQMIDAIKETPGIKAKDLSQRLQRSINTVDKQIKKLIDWQFIERRGSKKSGGYFIRANNKK